VRHARGEPIYDAGVQLGKLLRTAFLADYFVNAGFRRELRRVLNRGEAVNALKRAIYTGRVGPAQARRADEMQAVADALSLLANIVMSWNTHADADRAGSLGQPSPGGAARAHRAGGTYTVGGYQPAWRLPLPAGALCPAQILPSQTAAQNKCRPHEIKHPNRASAGRIGVTTETRCLTKHLPAAKEIRTPRQMLALRADGNRHFLH
jgi:hypothetical protein